jgi:hypothetical protein
MNNWYIIQKSENGSSCYFNYPVKLIDYALFYKESLIIVTDAAQSQCYLHRQAVWLKKTLKAKGYTDLQIIKVKNKQTELELK